MKIKVSADTSFNYVVYIDYKWHSHGHHKMNIPRNLFRAEQGKFYGTAHPQNPQAFSSVASTQEVVSTWMGIVTIWSRLWAIFPGVKILCRLYTPQKRIRL